MHVNLPANAVALHQLKNGLGSQRRAVGGVQRIGVSLGSRAEHIHAVGLCSRQGRGEPPVRGRERRSHEVIEIELIVVEVAHGAVTEHVVKSNAAGIFGSRVDESIHRSVIRVFGIKAVAITVAFIP